MKSSREMGQREVEMYGERLSKGLMARASGVIDIFNFFSRDEAPLLRYQVAA